MKFAIHKTSDGSYRGDDQEPPHPRARESPGTLWLVEVESLEDLLSFCDSGEIVLNSQVIDWDDPEKPEYPGIEIYDTFRE